MDVKWTDNHVTAELKHGTKWVVKLAVTRAGELYDWNTVLTHDGDQIAALTGHRFSNPEVARKAAEQAATALLELGKADVFDGGGWGGRR